MAKTIGVITVRTGSSRLPFKCLYPVNGKPLIMHLIDRLKQSEELHRIYIATTTKKEDDILEYYALDSEIKIFRGSEKNVVRRIANVAEKENADHIVRITGDDPFVDYEIMDEQIRAHKRFRNDVTINSYIPKGTETEVIRVSVIYDILAKAKSENTELFGVDLRSGRYKLMDYGMKRYRHLNTSVCVDTLGDYIRVCREVKHYLKCESDLFRVEHMQMHSKQKLANL